MRSFQPRFTRALWTALALVAGPASAQAADIPTEVFYPCEDQERWRLNDVFTQDERDPLRLMFQQSWNGPQLYRKGQELDKSGRTPELKALGRYLKARSYLRAGLTHVAYVEFQKVIAAPLPANEPIGARMAALACAIKLQAETPTLGWIDTASVQRLHEILEHRALPEPHYGERVAHALVTHVKELVNRGKLKEAREATRVLSLKHPRYALYARALTEQSQSKVKEAAPLWKALLADRELPLSFADDRDALLVLYARDLYELQAFDESAAVLRTVPHESNYLAQALSDLTWALLMGGKRKEAIGVAINLQKSLLYRVYSPEAPLVASIALHEICQYARALQNAEFFRKKYLPVLGWYESLTAEQRQKPYGLLTAALANQAQVPFLVTIEWLRSPVLRGLQTELNLLFEENGHAQAALRQKAGDTTADAYTLQAWKAPVRPFAASIDKRKKELVAKMNSFLGETTGRMAQQIRKMNENTTMLEIEIYDAAGEDMVWRNVNPKYAAYLASLPAEKREKSRFWEWGTISVDPREKTEVWEDELGWTVGNLPDECHLRQQFAGVGKPAERAPAAAAEE